MSYGHDLKSVWLLAEAASAAGLSGGLLLDLARALFASALRYGFDAQRGAFCEAGPLGAPADRRDKVWWVQAEALLSALYLYGVTSEAAYFTWFSRILAWIVNSQVDWKHGEWHARVGESGKPSGDKADAWKCPYHNGRAMIQCLELLPAIAGRSPPCCVARARCGRAPDGSPDSTCDAAAVQLASCQPF